MKALVDEIQIRKIAGLARLTLDSDEIASFTNQLTEIFVYVKQLEGLDTAGVEPFSRSDLSRNVQREDEPRAGCTHQQALSNAPEAVDGGFRVPGALPDK